MMIRAEESDLLKGFIVGKGKTRVSFLQYANDTILFSKAFLEYL